MKTIPFDHDNVPGLSSILAIPANYSIHAEDGVLSLTDSDSIIDIPVYDNDTFRVSEKMTIKAPGPLYEVQVSGIIPAVKSEANNILSDLTFGFWRIIVTDANGTVRLFGSADVPLLFSYDLGISRSSTNGHTFCFSGAQWKPAPVFNTFSLL